MNFARLTVLVVAIVTAGVAAFLVRNLTSSKGPAEAAPVQQVMTIPTQGVLVAKRTIKVGDTLTSSDVTWQEWPEAAVTPIYITQSLSGANDDWSGKTVRAEILSGEPVTRIKLVEIGNSGFMAAMLNPGMRAVSIEISAETGAGGFILPNDRVDVILTHEVEIDVGQRTERMHRSEIILANVRILAIDQTFTEGEDQRVVVGRTATLEVIPEQAETVALANSMGNLSLALRSLANPSDLASFQGDDTAWNPDGGESGIKVVRYGRESRTFVGSGQ